MKKHPVPDVMDALQKASKGLALPSEHSARLEPFLWPDGGDVSQATVLKHAGSAPGAAVEETTIDALFRVVPHADRPKFDPLLKVLHEQLTGVKVYKLGGEAERAVYVVGKTADGRWAGVRTTVVET
jgi:histidine triad (HIT) family protein